MKLSSMQFVVPALIVMGLVAKSDANEHHGRRFIATAQLSSFNEVPANLTGSHGSLRMTLSDDGTTLSFEFSWSGLAADPSAAHIHVGQVGVNGGVTIFFCGGGGQPLCPSGTSGSITGTATAANVLVPSGNSQGIQAGNLNQILDAMRRGLTYANIHNAPFPGGEARGQIHVRGGEREEGD